MKKNDIDKIIKYRALFNTPDGQEVLDDMMRVHHVMSPTLSKRPNGIEMAYREGERSVILRILYLLNSDPNDLRARIERVEKEQRDGSVVDDY